MNNKLASSILRAGRYENAKELIIEHGRQGSIIRINNGLDQETFQVSQAGMDDLKAQFKRLFGLDERDLAVGKRAKIRLGRSLISASISAIASGSSEKVRIEFLSAKPEIRPLSRLGLDTAGQKIITDALGRPGLIVVSSPDGEGSSTTAYSLLARLAGQEKSLAAIADFPEISIDGVNHFRKDRRKTKEQLQKIKRGDYDAILIADATLDELSSALDLAKEGRRLIIVETKANDAKQTIEALGLKDRRPGNLPSITISCQRLVDNNCPYCAKKYQLSGEQLKDIFPNIEQEVGRKGIPALLSSGCSRCNYRGYTKRLAAFELAAFQRDSTGPIVNIRPLLVDVFRKLINGSTSAKEAARLSKQL